MATKPLKKDATYADLYDVPENFVAEMMARQPKNPFHPGEILLEEFLEPLGVSQAAFAEKIGWTKARLNELIRGKRGVTAEAALDLAEVLGTSPKLWMNFQATYDL